MKPQRHRPGRRRQSPDDVPTVIDKSFCCDPGRDFELRLFGDAAPKIGVDVHHGENCRWLRKIECNIKTVANLHMEFPHARAGAPSIRGYPNESSPAFVPAARPLAQAGRLLSVLGARSRQNRSGLGRLSHLLRLRIHPVLDMRAIPAQFFQKLDNLRDLVLA